MSLIKLSYYSGWNNAQDTLRKIDFKNRIQSIRQNTFKKENGYNPTIPNVRGATAINSSPVI